MNLYKIFRISDALYLWLLGIGIGCIVAEGLAASVVFTISSFLPQLSTSDSGVIMGQIFVRCNGFFNILAGIIIIYEVITLLSAELFARSNQRRLWFIIGGISVIMIFLFTLYYTPFIMEAQAAGNLGTPEFDSMHKQSELVFKILMVSLSVSLIWRAIIGSTPASTSAPKA